MGRINDVLLAMAKVDRLDEVVVFELCDEHGLDTAEEMVVLSMYHNAMGNNETVSVSEAFSEPELPKVNGHKTNEYVLTAGFGM